VKGENKRSAVGGNRREDSPRLIAQKNLFHKKKEGVEEKTKAHLELLGRLGRERRGGADVSKPARYVHELPGKMGTPPAMAQIIMTSSGMEARVISGGGRYKKTRLLSRDRENPPGRGIGGDSAMATMSSPTGGASP